MTSTQNKLALCAFRNDLSQRAAASITFLRTHPQGFAGIPVAVIQQQIDNEQRTIDTLRFLRCQ